MNVLDFNKIEKASFNITLNDENKTTLNIYTPTKGTMDYLISLHSKFSENNEVELDDSFTDELYTACAKTMSRNSQNIKISKEFLEDILDFEDITIFFTAFMNFINEVTNGKN